VLQTDAGKTAAEAEMTSPMTSSSTRASSIPRSRALVSSPPPQTSSDVEQRHSTRVARSSHGVNGAPSC